MATDISSMLKYGVPRDVATETAMLVDRLKAKQKVIDDGEGGTRLSGVGLNNPDALRLRELQRHPAFQNMPKGGAGIFGGLGDWLGDLGPMIATGALAGWGATGGFDSLFGAAPGGAGAVGVTGAEAVADVAPGFFDDILASSTVGEAGATAGGAAAGGEVFRDPFDLLEDPTIVYQPPGSNIGLPDILGGLPSLSGILGGGGWGGGGGNILSGLFGNRDLLGTGLAVAPSLAAIAYAKNQDPFNTTRLEQAYGQIDPESLALPFDLQTGRGRESLTSSLSDRGVMGSSFGNQDLASYDVLRHAGRQNILTQGAQAQAGIAGQILDAEVKDRALKNDLYGRALLALSAGLNPPQTNINVGIPGAGTTRPSGGNTDILKLLGFGGSLSNIFG